MTHSFTDASRSTWTRIRTTLSPWSLMAGLMAMIVLIPIGVVLTSLWADTREIWAHLASTVLPRYVLNSLGLVLGVGLGSALIGIATAWLITMCRFWGRRIFEVVLLLPLSAPAYVLAYTYTDFLEFSGPVQTFIRQTLDLEAGQYWFPSVRSLGGAILMLTLVLYPYVYLVTRLAFLEQSSTTLEASRSLGCGPWQTFGRVAIPLARPSIMASVSLVSMETLNDYGTVQHFGLQTFSTGIFRTWYGLGERVAATQLASLLLVLALSLILLERWSRRQARYYQSGHRHGSYVPYSLTGLRTVGAWAICSLPVILGFLLPGFLLVLMTLDSLPDSISPRFWGFARNSLMLSLITAVLAAAISLVLAYARRIHTEWSLRAAIQVASIGYAIPGSVIAVGVLISIGWLDNTLDSWFESWFGISTGLIFSGSVVAIVFAYLVRFLAVSFGTIEASLLKIRPHLDEAAQSLGSGRTKTFFNVHVPLLWRGVLTAMLLVFVDVMKELPATIVIRPFNFDTLAVRANQLASDERLAEAAAPALLIVLVGILPVMILSWQITHSRH